MDITLYSIRRIEHPVFPENSSNEINLLEKILFNSTTFTSEEIELVGKIIRYSNSPKGELVGENINHVHDALLQLQKKIDVKRTKI
jgi:hypothetical protein